MTHLIGTDALKPYMHGYFIDLRLYTKARAIANPFAYAEHRERLIRNKLELEQESRIRGAKKSSGTALPAGVKVNRSLAKKATEAEERTSKRAAGVVEDDGTERKRKKKNGGVETPSLLKDDRFGSLFTNPDFQIDEDSREFALLNPSTKPKVRLEVWLVWSGMMLTYFFASRVARRRRRKRPTSEILQTTTTTIPAVPTTRRQTAATMEVSCGPRLSRCRR